MNEKTVRQLGRILVLGLSVLALVYIVYQVYLVAHEAVRTEVARQATVDDTVSADLFAVRKESYLETDEQGIKIPLVSSGSRVAAGEGVLAIFDSEDDASDYAELASIQENLNRYNRLNQQKNTYAVNVSAMSKQISRGVIDLAETVDSGDLTGLQDQIYDVRDQIITRQIATGTSINLENKVTELETRHSALTKTAQLYDPLVSENSGYFIDSADGYENTVDYDSVKDLTPKEVKKILKADPDKVSDDVIGKVSTDFDWYLVCVLDKSKAKALEVGNTVTIDLPYSAVSSVPATVASKSKASGDDVAVVFRCDRMNAYIASLRKEQGEIVMHTYTGLKIPKEAVTKNEDGDEGVYVLEGNIAKFKKLRTLYTTDEFVISGETAKEGETGDYVKLYDAVITGGKNIYDGQILD